jgi:hypothetical protein
MKSTVIILSVIIPTIFCYAQTVIKERVEINPGQFLSDHPLDSGNLRRTYYLPADLILLTILLIIMWNFVIQPGIGPISSLDF